MSMVECDSCGAPFNSDDDPGCFMEEGAQFDGETWIPRWIVLCQNCREEDDERA